MSLKRFVSFASVVALLGCEAPASPSTKTIPLQPTPTLTAQPAGEKTSAAEEKIKLLTRIEVLIEVGWLTTPKDNCAYSHLQEALKKYPKSKEVQALRNDLITAIFAGLNKGLSTEEALSALEALGADKAKIDEQRSKGEKGSEKNLEDASAQVKLGDQRFKESNFSEAEEHYQDALKLSPKLTAAKLGLAKVAFQQQKFAESANYATTILGYTPNNVEALVLLGDARYKSYNYQGALEAYQKALAISPGSTPAQRGEALAKKSLAK